MKTNTVVAALQFTRNTVLIAMLGILIGAMVVMLPPMAAIGVVGLVAVVLVWVTPEINQVSLGALRKVFLFFLIIQVCVPAYYALQIAGIPWISPRRIIAMLLIVAFFLFVGTSRGASRAIGDAIHGSRLLVFCIIGFLFMAFASIFTSISPADSLTHFSDAVLNWYVPMFACLLVVESEADIVRIYKLIGILSLFVASVGIVEFATQHRVALDFIPKSLLYQMASSNPVLAILIQWNPIRNGFWRASSIFTIPLSFGEFAVMVAPLGAYFILHGAKWTERVLGIAVLITSMLSLFVSGSRGGSIGFLISMPVFAALWIVRYSRANPKALAGAMGAVLAVVGTASIIALIFLWKRLYNIVLGGGDTAASNDARLIQWTMGMPSITANPITGHGLGMGAIVVGYYQPDGTLTVDSYILTLLVETGVPGLVCFFGIIAIAIYYCVNIYIRKFDDARTAIAAALACNLIAFGFYRIALSQKENHTLFFVFIGLVLKLRQCVAARERVSKADNPNSPERTPRAFDSRERAGYEAT